MEKKEQNSPSQTVLTVVDAALFLRVSESVVRRLIRERRIPFFRIEGRYLFYVPCVEEWMRTITVSPDGQAGTQAAQVIATHLWEIGGK
jgi:excisionase family DNA binding protein